MTASSYETRRYAGHWKIPWGTVKSFEFERSSRLDATATQCSVDVDMLGLWRRVVDRRRGLFSDVEIVSTEQQIQLTFLGPGRVGVASVSGTWNLDAIHGQCLRFGGISSLENMHAEKDSLDREFRALLRQAEREYPNVLVRGDTLYWIPAICLGKLRTLWREVGEPQCGDLILQRCERRSNEVQRLHYSSAHISNQQLMAPASSERAIERHESSSSSEDERFAREFEQLMGASLGAERPRPRAETLTPRPRKDSDDQQSHQVASAAGLRSQTSQADRDDDSSFSDMLLLRLQKLREAIRDDVVHAWVNDEISELMLQYPDRPEVYLLGFEIFARSHDVTRAWNTLDTLERLDSPGESINYELAKARKKLANLVDRVGRGPSDSIVAWIKYALLRPLDGAAFQRVLRFAQDIGIHEDFEKLVRLRIAAILERDDPSSAVPAETALNAKIRYPAEAIYPAIMLIALTTRSAPEARARVIGSFRANNEFPQEWWDDVVQFADHIGPLPSVEDEAEIWADVVREVAVELAATPPEDTTQPSSEQDVSGGDPPISYERRSAELRARRGQHGANVDPSRDEVGQTSDLPDLHIADSDPGSADTNDLRQSHAPSGLKQLDEIAASGRLDAAIAELVRMLRVTDDQEMRSELLLRKARWLRESDEDARKVSFALTGVRILKPHSLDVHMEFIHLYVRENLASKAREAAISLLDSLVAAHEPLDYVARGILPCLRAAGIDSSRVLPSRLQSDMEKTHPVLLDLLGHD